MDTVDNDFPNPKAAEIIRDYAFKTGFTNVKLTMKAGSSKGDNFVGLVFKVKIEGTKGNKRDEMNIIVKAAPISEDARHALPLRNLFLREIFGYTDLFPTYMKLQNSVNMEKSDIYQFPECFTVNTELLNEFIVMQDLSVYSYMMHEPKIEPLDFKHVSIALRTLAKFHGLSYVLQMRKPMLFYEYIGKIPEVLINMNEPFQPMVQFFQASSEKAMETLKDTPEFDIFKKLASDTFNYLGKIIQPQKYAVICHGDYWKNNMLFKYLNQQRPTSVLPLDYQMLRYSSPATDITYFLFLCTSQKLRNEKYYEMLEIYHEALEDYLLNYSIRVEDVFPRDEFYKEIKRAGCFGLGMAICVLIFLTTSGDELSDVSTAVKNEIGLNADSESFKLYKERLHHILQDSIKYGLIE